MRARALLVVFITPTTHKWACDSYWTTLSVSLFYYDVTEFNTNKRKAATSDFEKDFFNPLPHGDAARHIVFKMTI